MKYILDSNVWIAMMQGRRLEVETHYRTLDPADVHVCSPVVAELRRGAEKSADPVANHALVDDVLEDITSLPFDDEAAAQYGKIRSYLESTGQVIGVMDMLIAAIAFVHDCTVVTHNTKDFGRVAGLKLEDWQNP